MPVATGHKHATAGYANGSAVAAGAIVSREAEPIGGKAVEVRRLDILVAMGTDCVWALIVGEKENDIGSICGESRAY